MAISVKYAEKKVARAKRFVDTCKRELAAVLKKKGLGGGTDD